MFWHVCLGLTDFRISSSKPDFVKDVHSPFRGLFWAIDPQSFVHMNRLNFPLLLFLLLTPSSPSHSNEKKVCTCIWDECLDFLQQPCTFQNLFYSMFFLLYSYVFSIFFPVSSIGFDFNDYFPVFCLSLKMLGFFPPVNDLFSTQPFLSAYYLHEVDFNPLYKCHICWSWFICIWFPQVPQVFAKAIILIGKVGAESVTPNKEWE